MLNYRIQGEGVVCVFLHGFLESISMWDYLPISELGIRSIFIDLPGHGASALDDDDVPSIEHMAKEVEKILIAEKVGKFHIVGHSMGGYVALALKARLSNCKNVVLLNSNYWSDSDSKKRDRERVSKIAYQAKNYFVSEAIPNLFSDRKTYEKEIRTLVAEAQKLSPEAIAYASLAMRDRKDHSSLLKKKDVIVLHGAQDNQVEKAQFDLKLIGEGCFFEIPSSGHMSYIENSGKVIDVLKRCLN